MSTAADGDEDVINDFLLADDEGGNGGADFVKRFSEMSDGGFEFGGSHGGLKIQNSSFKKQERVWINNCQMDVISNLRFGI
jgi:hypothetical protein